MQPDILNLSFGQILQAKLNEVPNENPTKYLQDMYKSVNPGMIQAAVQEAKRMLKRKRVGNKGANNNSSTTDSSNSSTPHKCNVYFTLGGDSLNQSFFTGAISALLWLQEYINVAHDAFGCSKKDVDTCKQVLNKIGLPKSADVNVDVHTGDITQSSSCRHYATFLASLVQWMSMGITAFHVDGPMKSNLEMARFISGVALNQFPSIPYTAYFIGQTETNDMMELAERMSKTLDFNKYMTPESITLNQPQFVVQNECAPLVGISGHPLAQMVYGQSNNGKVEWYGLFQESEEFEKLCIKNGISSHDVKKYMYQTSWKQHEKNIARGDRMALFIDSQKFIKEVFEMRQKEYGMIGGDTNGVDDDDNYAI